MLPTDKTSAGAEGPRKAQWHQTPPGRITAGLVVGLGLSIGLLLLASLALRRMELAPQAAAGVFLGIQALALLAGGMLAGAGQSKGITYGAAVGLMSACLAFAILFSGVLASVIEPFSKESLIPLPPPQPLTPQALMAYGMPLTHFVFGLLGGMIGMAVWRPLPKLSLPASVPSEQKPILGTKISLPPQGDKKAVFPWAGPIAWIRVLIGIGVAVGGAVWTPKILSFLVEMGGLQQADIEKGQEYVAHGELLALSVLIGGAIAGATTRNGLKQGVLVGFGGGILTVAYLMATGGAATGPEKLIGPLLASIFLGPIGGWFGSDLMPAAPKGRVLNRRKGWF